MVGWGIVFLAVGFAFNLSGALADGYDAYDCFEYGYNCDAGTKFILHMTSVPLYGLGATLLTVGIVNNSIANSRRAKYKQWAVSESRHGYKKTIRYALSPAGAKLAYSF